MVSGKAKRVTKKVTRNRNKIRCQSVASQLHYTRFTIQPLEFIMKNKLSPCEANVIKYICRWRLKDGIKDLEKAKVYIDFLIKEAKGLPIISEENK